jgi:hypothetical protein
MGLTAKPFFAAALVLLAGMACIATAQSAPAGEQMSFSEDAPLQHTVALSPDVLEVLFQTQEARQALNFASDSTQDHPARLFRATEVHLSRPDETDLVVIGVPPMSGADCGWFWIVRLTRGGPQVVLFAGANSLDLRDSRTSGYRDIVTTSASAGTSEETTFHFNGKSYKAWKKKTQNRD